MKKFPMNIDFILEPEKTNEEVIVQQLKKVLNKILNDLKDGELFTIKLNMLFARNNLRLDFNSHVTFFEVSSRDPIIMYKAGYHMAKNATVSFIQNEYNSEKLHSTILNDIVLFSDIDKLLNQESQNQILRNVIKKEIETYFFPNNHLNKFWFDKNKKGIIYIVGGPDDEKSKEDLNQNIYDYGDKDTFIETCIFLAKHFPDYTIKTATSNDELLDWQNNHLVVIGGPGVEGDPGNTVCLELMKEVKSNFSYGQDINIQNNTNQGAYYLQLNDKKFYSKTKSIKTQEIVTIDYGYFSCFENPFNQSKRVILINGIHTLGVLGSFRTFTQNEEDSKSNCKNVISKFLDYNDDNSFLNEEMLGFECYFEVKQGYNSMPPVPIVKSENIFFLKEHKNRNEFEVFLSHSSENIEETSRIKNELENNNISTCIAPRDMEVGKWKPQIKAKIEQEKLKILVLILTKEAQESEIVEYEISTAIRAKKMVIAYQPENFEIDDLFDKLINDTHKVIAYDNTHQNPTEELIRLVSNYLKK